MKVRYILAISISVVLIIVSGIILSIFANRATSELTNKFFPSFYNTNIGDICNSNRDGYHIKLNNNFFADIDHHYDGVSIYKIVNHPYVDIADCVLYYTGVIDKCYCSDNYLIVYLPNDDNYVLIDCNVQVNQKVYNSISEIDLDLSGFTLVEDINFENLER